jgi:hypothetical protein
MNITKAVKFDQICKSIMNIDKNVRSVTLLNDKGIMMHNEILLGFMQPNFDKWSDTHYMECTFDISMGTKFDGLYGSIRYHHSNKDDFIMFSFPYNKDVIIVISTKKISPIAFATKISQLINNTLV